MQTQRSDKEQTACMSEQTLLMYAAKHRGKFTTSKEH